MEVLGTTLAILSAIDLCIKYGERLVEACQTFRKAETVVRERALRVEVNWKRTREQLRFIREAHEKFDQELTDLQLRIFDVLESKLKKLTRDFDGMHNKMWRLQRLRVITAREHLDKAIAELEDWQSLFDPSWVVILKLASRAPEMGDHNGIAGAIVPKDDSRVVGSMRRALDGTSTSVFFPDDPLASAEKLRIAYSTAWLAQKLKDGKSYILETVTLRAGMDRNILAKDVKVMAARLQSVDPARFSMLQCKGVIRNKDGDTTTSFELVLRPPKAFLDPPSSFRTLLGTLTGHSLTERLRIARQLARAICYVHTLEFVHKNVRPESILVFEQEGTELGSLFLVGFQSFRAADGRTLLNESARWDIDLYRHPDRHGEHPGEAYVMQHDMYSLGVCLLEIGLWSSFVVYTAEDETPTPGNELGVSADFFQDPKAVKEKLVTIATETLPRQMGNKFAQVVVDCLTCLDPENPHFTDHTDFEDVDGIHLGVKYIEKVLLELESISL